MEDEKNNSVLIKKIIVAACAVFLALAIIALIINLVHLSAANARKAELLEQSAYLDTLIDKNESVIKYCESDEFIENYAREYLDMIYRDELPVEVE